MKTFKICEFNAGKKRLKVHRFEIFTEHNMFNLNNIIVKIELQLTSV